MFRYLVTGLLLSLLLRKIHAHEACCVNCTKTNHASSFQGHPNLSQDYITLIIACTNLNFDYGKYNWLKLVAACFSAHGVTDGWVGGWVLRNRRKVCESHSTSLFSCFSSVLCLEILKCSYGIEISGF